jgi:mycothiol synthase
MSTSPILPNLKQGYIFRAPTLDDAAAVVELVNANALKVVGHGDETLENIRSEWDMPGVNVETDSRLVFAPSGQLIAYIHVMDHVRPMTPYVDTYLHPDFWGDPMADELMKWGEERARAAFTNPKVPGDAQVIMMAATYATDAYYKSVLEKAGMSITRIQWRMEIDLTDAPPAPEWPDGITVRGASADGDWRPILDAIRGSFRDHWGYVERPFDEHYQRWTHEWQGHSDFDPALWLLAMDGDEIAGFSLCRQRYEGDDSLGWVSTLGVLRPYRKHGLGMALLRHSFGELYRRGKTRVGLGVDAGSLTGATRLYQRAGMHIAVQFEVYEKELRPGKDYRTKEVDGE